MPRMIEVSLEAANGTQRITKRFPTEELRGKTVEEVFFNVLNQPSTEMSEQATRNAIQQITSGSGGYALSLARGGGQSPIDFPLVESKDPIEVYAGNEEYLRDNKLRLSALSINEVGFIQYKR